MEPEEGQLEPPERKPHWWLKGDKTPSQRGINAVMALGTLMAVVVAVVAIVVSSGASQSVTEIKSQTNKTVGTDNSRTTTVNNYYESGNGAPGQATPTQPDENTQSASIACGNSASNVLGGWGPDRPTFTMNNPSPFTTLDSIRNNPEFGDERGLMGVRDAASGNSGPANTWSYSAEVQPGHIYRVRMLIKNSTFDGNADLAATNTKVSVSLPTCSGNRIASNGFVTSEVAYPTKIWGGVTFTSKQQYSAISSTRPSRHQRIASKPAAVFWMPRVAFAIVSRPSRWPSFRSMSIIRSAVGSSLTRSRIV